MVTGTVCLSGGISILDGSFSGLAEFAGIDSGDVFGADLDGELFVHGDTDGSISFEDLTGEARIAIDGSLRSHGLYEIYVGSLGPDAAITIDFDGWQSGDDWDSGASVRVNTTTYTHNGQAARVWEITECHGDMNNDGTINLFDIDGFAAALDSVASYADLFPGLEGAIRYHGDINGDGSFNLFDIDPFVALIETPCCNCSPFAGGMSAEDVAQMLGDNIDVSRLPGFVDKLEQLAGEFWEDVVEFLEE